MKNYKLKNRISENSMKSLYQRQEKIVLVKHTMEENDFKVAWVAFRPFMNNIVEWKDEYSLYVSNNEIQNGVTLNKLSEIKAVPQIIYRFKNGVFNDPLPYSAVGFNTYAVKNEFSGYQELTFGIAQNVMINGEVFVNKPINALRVTYKQTATITPLETLDVYLKNDVENSTIVGNHLKGEFTLSYEEKTEYIVEYDDKLREFYIVK